MADMGAMFTQKFDAARAALSNGDQAAAAESLRAAVVVARSNPALKRELASALLQLGKLSEKLGRAGEAEQLLTEALAISEQLFGMENPALAPLLNELSRLHIAQSHHQRAEAALERLLGIVRAKGEEQPEVATALAGLALVKRRIGDDAAAEALYRDALRIREKVLPANHMVTVVTLEQLSETCEARGNLTEALALLQRALPTREEAVGAGHATMHAARTRLTALELQIAVATDAAARTAAAAARGSMPTPQWIKAVPEAPAPVSDPNELVFLYKPEPRVRRTAPVAAPRERAKTPTRTAAVAAAPLVISPIQVMPVGDMIIPSSESAHESVGGRRSGAMHRDVVRDDVAHHADTRVSDRQSVIAMVHPESAARAPKSRTVLYASVAGAAAVVIAIAGLTMRSSGGKGGEAASTDASADPRTTAVGAPGVTTVAANNAAKRTDAVALARAARADSARSVTVPTVQPERRAPEITPSPSQTSVAFVPFNPSAVKIATIGTTNVDSIVRLSTKRGRESDNDQLGAGVAAPTAMRSDDASSTPPTMIERAVPRFPDALRSIHPRGEVLVRFKVDERGRVDVASMVVMKSDHELFTSAVRNILPLFRFEPARTRGADPKPVAVWVSLPFQFTAKN